MTWKRSKSSNLSKSRSRKPRLRTRKSLTASNWSSKKPKWKTSWRTWHGKLAKPTTESHYSSRRRKRKTTGLYVLWPMSCLHPPSTSTETSVNSPLVMYNYPTWWKFWLIIQIVGINPENNELTVGFRVSSYKKGSFAVGPVHHLPHLPDSMKKTVKLLEDHFRASGLKAFDAENHSGTWRQVKFINFINYYLFSMLIFMRDYSTGDHSHQFGRWGDGHRRCSSTAVD